MVCCEILTYLTILWTLDIIYRVKVRNSRSQVFFRIGVLKNFAIFTGRHLCWSLFLMKSQAFRPASLLNRDFNIGVFLWILPEQCVFYEMKLFSHLASAKVNSDIKLIQLFWNGFSLFFRNPGCIFCKY